MHRLILRRTFLVLIGCAYVTMGCYLYFRRKDAIGEWGALLSVLFVGYGIWRIFRGITAPDHEQHENSDPSANS